MLIQIFLSIFVQVKEYRMNIVSVIIQLLQDFNFILMA